MEISDHEQLSRPSIQYDNDIIQLRRVIYDLDDIEQRLRMLLWKLWPYIKTNPNSSHEIYAELSFYENSEIKDISEGISRNNKQNWQKRKMNQQDLADRLNIHQSTVS